MRDKLLDMITSTLLLVLTGIGLGLATIVAIGPQNAFVLRQGMRGDHVAAVLTICILSDLILIGVVLAGVGALASLPPMLWVVLRWAGSAYLLAYSVVAARRALRPSVLEVASRHRPALRPTVATTLALTWLNPHVYVDMVLVVGAVGAGYPSASQRWAFGAGLAVASVAWFLSLGVAARLVRPYLSNRTTWRVLDGGIAVIMAITGIALLRG